jgi:hypothetical protein
MSRQRQSLTSKREIKMRKSVLMPLVAAVMAFGSWLPSAAVARPPQGSQARCFDNYGTCYTNADKCVSPGPRVCRDRCEVKYKACLAAATSGGWSSPRGGGSAVTISSGTPLVTKPGSPAAGNGTTAVTISSGTALVTTPNGNGKSGPVTTLGGASTVSSQPAAPSSGASTRSQSGGGGSLNGVGNGGPTKRKQQ